MRVVSPCLSLALLALSVSGCATRGFRRQEFRYGGHKRNVLDFWRADGEDPTPVLICFHGGGFMMGSKFKFRWRSLTRECLESGISVVAANYRLVRGEGAAPYPAPMQDGARVVQFVRSKAGDWNIDPDRIALTGGSAGGNMSLWIAYHDDLADPESNDPVKRQSSRVSCVLARDAQTSNDPEWFWENIMDTKEIGKLFFPFYGVRSWQDLKKPEIRKRVADASPMSHLSADDPPVLLLYLRRPTSTPLPADAGLLDAIHHPRFGLVLQQEAAELGVRCKVYHADNPAPEGTKLRFLREELLE